MIRVEIPMLPPAALNPNARGHWTKRARATSDYRRAAFACAYNANITHEVIFTRAKVSVCVVMKNYQRQEADPDNLIRMLKPAIDGCVDAKILEDDRKENIEYQWPLSYEVDPERAPLTILEFEAWNFKEFGV